MSSPFINHIELQVTNLKEAKKFYSSLFSLKVNILPQMSYAIWEAAKQPGGGMAEVKKVKHGGTTAYFQVDNINNYLKKAKELGGKIVEKKTQIGGDMGYYGLLQDPFGNKVGVWSNK